MIKNPFLSSDRLCIGRKEGGLGVSCIYKLNRALLLCKWLWRFANERDSLLRKVVCMKFSEESGGYCCCYWFFYFFDIQTGQVY